MEGGRGKESYEERCLRSCAGHSLIMATNTQGGRLGFFNAGRTSALLLFILTLVVNVEGESTIASSRSLNSSDKQDILKLSKIHKHLRRINKPAIKTIRSPDGDIIDCIRRRQQAAFDHPLLKDHKIHDLPQRPSGFGVDVNRTNYDVRGSQIWHINGHCPKGTIPVRRTTVDDLLRAESPRRYGKKFHGRHGRFAQKPDVVNGNGHEHAISYVQGEEFYGAKATINVWDPRVESMNEFSLSQLWVLSGSFDGSDLNSIEAGWQVSPQLYGDGRPRLFTYWTSDAYQETGCYNLLCSGFVQTNNRIAIGAAISPVSKYAGTQYDITILIWKDPKQGNWWMEFAGSTLVGYWPSELFTHLADHANMVEWGGEIVNTEARGGHTFTQMGSGHFAEEGFSRASYFRNLEIVDDDNSLRAVDSMSTLAEHTNCYDVRSSVNNDWGTHFYYGGPGNNPRCH